MDNPHQKPSTLSRADSFFESLSSFFAAAVLTGMRLAVIGIALWQMLMVFLWWSNDPVQNIAQAAKAIAFTLGSFVALRVTETLDRPSPT